jgi:nitronate monooxygenase
LVFHDVTTIKHARKAVEAGVDGLILICGGGGGHSGLLNPFAFVPQVREFFDGVIVLAGAIASGSAVLAAEMLGADLCYMGTRFIATQEAMAEPAYKAMICSAESHDLIYTGVFSRGVPAMLLKHSLRDRGFDPDKLPSPQEAAETGVKVWRDIWAAGQSVGLIKDIPNVAELVERLKHEYAAAESAVSRT